MQEYYHNYLLAFIFHLQNENFHTRYLKCISLEQIFVSQKKVSQKTLCTSRKVCTVENMFFGNSCIVCQNPQKIILTIFDHLKMK